jgi:hypothetical protein
VRIKEQPKIVEVLVAEDVGCDVPEAIDILAESIYRGVIITNLCVTGLG